MENRIEFRIYNASPNCFSFAHMRIVWDAARASAAGGSFGDVLVLTSLAACCGAFAGAANPKKRGRGTGRVGSVGCGAFRTGFGVKVLRNAESRKDRIAVDHPWHCMCCASLPQNVSQRKV